MPANFRHFIGITASRACIRAFAAASALALAFGAPAFATQSGLVPSSASRTAARPPLAIPMAQDARAKSRPDALPVRFNREAMLSLATGAEVELALADGRRQAYAFEEIVDYGGGIRSWVGRSTQPGRGERAVITLGPDAVFGWMHTPWGEYRIATEGGLDWIAMRPPDAARSPEASRDTMAARDDPPHVAGLKGIPTPAPPLVQQKALMQGKTTPSPVFNLDLMILYPADLAGKMGPALMPMMYNFVTTANTIFADSEVALNVRLVRTALVDVPASVGSGFALEGMAGNLSEASRFQAFTWGVGSLRDQVGADVVTLARETTPDSNFIAGIAKILRNPTLYPAVAVAQSDAYSVLTNCSQGCGGVWAHEVGHNLGLMHDRATVARDNGGTVPTNQGVFPYAFGHYQCQNGLACNPFVANGCLNQVPACVNATGDDFGTVMSYVGPRAFRYSNPLVRCPVPGGSVPGPFCGVAGQDDNARAMNETRQNASAYRNATLATLPGSLQFTKTLFANRESNGAIVFTVSRIGGSGGSVSVSYATTGATAASGTDFTATSGTLTWADGDAADKTFSVALVNDGVSEDVESFTVTLSNPSGAPGVHLGHPVTAVGAILDPWPPNGAAPAGFSSASTPTAPWAVASDSFDPAGADTTSWKSGALPANATGTSSTVFTGTFAGGTISFSYRVSSYPFAPALSFLIDGQESFADAGDTGQWKSVTRAITAGAHTLEWRFTKVLDFACSSAGGPNGETYPACQDRAWIDSVSLPIARSADLSIAQAVSPSTGSIGKDLVYTYTVANAGPTPATGTVLSDTLSGLVAFVWASPGCSLLANVVTCPIGILDPGASAQRKVVVRPISIGTATNVAQATSLDPDPVPANNVANGPVTVSGVPVGVAVQRYRLFSPVTKEHLYTTDLNEYNVLGSFVGTWNQEGTVGKVLNNPGAFGGVSATPYYRLYNTATAQHHWTTDANEYYTLILFPQYSGEGVDGYILPTQAPGSIPLYRLLYPFSVPVAGLHHWTIDPVEYSQLISVFGWVGEGGSGFVIP